MKCQWECISVSRRQSYWNVLTAASMCDCRHVSSAFFHCSRRRRWRSTSTNSNLLRRSAYIRRLLSTIWLISCTHHTTCTVHLLVCLTDISRFPCIFTSSQAILPDIKTGLWNKLLMVYHVWEPSFMFNDVYSISNTNHELATTWGSQTSEMQ